MRFKVDDYLAGCTAYQIELYITNLTIEEYKRIVEQFRYHCRKDGISWMCGYSTHDSDTAKAESIHTGKRGRPKKRIIGSGADSHQHNLFIGSESKSAYSTAHRIAGALDKKYKRKVCRVKSISDGLHLHNSIGYITRQSDVMRSGGAFDFQEYYNRTHELFC